MHSPYSPLHTMPKVPDMPVNPPEPDDEEWERNNRNVIRLDAIAAIDILEFCLEELSDSQGNGFNSTRRDLAELRDYLQRDMDD